MLCSRRPLRGHVAWTEAPFSFKLRNGSRSPRASEQVTLRLPIRGKALEALALEPGERAEIEA